MGSSEGIGTLKLPLRCHFENTMLLLELIMYVLISLIIENQMSKVL